MNITYYQLKTKQEKCQEKQASSSLPTKSYQKRKNNSDYLIKSVAILNWKRTTLRKGVYFTVNNFWAKLCFFVMWLLTAQLILGKKYRSRSSVYVNGPRSMRVHNTLLNYALPITYKGKGIF